MKDIVKQYTCKIENELRGIYKTGPKLLVEPIHHVFSGKGKRIRPLLTLFTSNDHTDHVYIGVGVTCSTSRWINGGRDCKYRWRYIGSMLV